MRALVVYESMFGNTRAVAEAVAEGLAAGIPVDVVEVGTAPAGLPDQVGLLVVGGPTHAFGLSRPQTRRSAAEQTDRSLVSTRTGLREWLAAVPGAPAGAVAAAFDTRMDKPRLPGAAGRRAQKRLRRHGFRIAAPATSFYVTGPAPHQLVTGELDRARQWGERLAASLPHSSRT